MLIVLIIRTMANILNLLITLFILITVNEGITFIYFFITCLTNLPQKLMAKFYFITIYFITFYFITVNNFKMIHDFMK